MDMQPALTVITVVRNAREVIRNCIDSVISQHVEGLEYIVIDGASTDGTVDIVRSYGSAVATLISEPDRGLYDAMNKGLRLARGKYIHFLNADDRYLSADVLAQLLPQLEEQSVNYGQLVYRDGNGNTRILGAPFVWEKELCASRIPQPALFVAKALYDQVSEFDLRYRIAADYDMVLRLTSRFPVKYIPQPVTLMQAGGISHRHMQRAFKEAAIISQHHGRSFVGSRSSYFYRLLRWQVARHLPPAWVIKYRQLCGRA